jgi:undecaprenyl pyrophosphate phosphatase UppP
MLFLIALILACIAEIIVAYFVNKFYRKVPFAAKHPLMVWALVMALTLLLAVIVSNRP